MTQEQQRKQPLPAIFRPKEASEYMGFSRTKLWQLEQTDPDFPRKIRFSSRCVGWRKVDLDRYLELKAGGAA